MLLNLVAILANRGTMPVSYEAMHGAGRSAVSQANSTAMSDPSLPWLVDRALRHLLTDLTGNTHRAEFCIDKLYSPDSSRGRLGRPAAQRDRHRARPTGSSTGDLGVAGGSECP